jgi:protein involved in polysaccharide export with SLBB domain
MHLALPVRVFRFVFNFRALPFFLFPLLTACKNNDPTGDAPPPSLPLLAPRPAAPTANDTFQVGDVLELLVEEDATFSSTYQVREGGYILIPKVGRIPVVNLTRSAAEIKIKETLQQGQLKQATVFVERQASPTAAASPITGLAATPRMMVYLTGGVSRPGQHYVPLRADGSTPGVYETLLVTGGLAKFANEGRVKIMRLDSTGVRRSIPVDVRKIKDGELSDVPVGDGDIINVEEKVFGF